MYLAIVSEWSKQCLLNTFIWPEWKKMRWVSVDENDEDMDSRTLRMCSVQKKKRRPNRNWHLIKRKCRVFNGNSKNEDKSKKARKKGIKMKKIQIKTRVYRSRWVKGVDRMHSKRMQNQSKDTMLDSWNWLLLRISCFFFFINEHKTWVKCGLVKQRWPFCRCQSL